MKKLPWKIVLVSLLGNVIIGLGVSTVRFAKWGIDPFTSMCTGACAHLGLPLGVFQSCLNLGLLILLIALSRKNLRYINIGAIVNMFLLGFIVQFFTSFYCGIFDVVVPEDVQFGLLIQLPIFIGGILCVTLGCSLYINADLGTGAYDALSLFMAEKLPFPYAICRIITDVTCVVISFLVGGPLGITTVIFMIGTGPIVSFWNKTVSIPLVQKLKQNS